MFSLKVAQIVSGVGGAVVLILTSKKVEAKEMVACHDCHMKRLPKAHELPIYSKTEDFISEYDKNSTLPLLSEISSIRKKLFEYGSYVSVAGEKVMHIYDTGVAHSKTTFDYLKDEENKIQRAAIIASSGLLGLLLARKRGIFKKVIYTSVGTGAAFSAFYPTLSKEYALTGWNASKKHIDSALKNYGGGYDTEKLEKEVQEKLESIKSIMMFESVMKTMREKFYSNKALKEGEDKSKESSTNQDMYTTRSAP